MVDKTTIFHPILLDTLSVPFSLVLGVLIILLLNRIWIGVLVSLCFYNAFDFWFWNHFYEGGFYHGDNILDGNYFFSFLTAVLTICLGYVSLKLKNDLKN